MKTDKDIDKLWHDIKKYEDALKRKQEELTDLIDKIKPKQCDIHSVSVSLPSIDDAGVIAVSISEINNEMTAQEQAFFVAGFQECVKYLNLQSNER